MIISEKSRLPLSKLSGVLYEFGLILARPSNGESVNGAIRRINLSTVRHPEGRLRRPEGSG